MSFRKKSICFLFCLLLFVPFVSFAQPSWYYEFTGTNHTIIVPNSIPLTIDGTQISQGDYIGVFFDSLGTLSCGGYAIWQGTTTSIAAWGADDGNDGFATGETFTWKIWRVSDAQEFSAQASYLTGSYPNQGNFSANGISGLGSLSATSISGPDIAIISILSPQSACQLSANEQVSVFIQNVGTIPIYTFDIQYSLSSGTIQTQQYSGNLASGATSTITFNTIENLSNIGIYQITAVANLIGDNNQFNDTIYLSVENYGFPQFDLGNNISVLEGETYEIDAGNWASYLWNTGESTETITAIQPGTYSVTISDQNNCQSNDAIEISYFSGTPDWYFNSTGTNHIIYIADTNSISIDGIQIQTGDYIGVFYDSLGTLTCGGYIMWENLTTTLVSWGEDLGNDGFASNEEFKWKIWDGSEGSEHNATATYSDNPLFPDSNLFVTNGISGLNTLAASSINIDISGTNITCFGENNGEIDITISGGIAPYSFSWSNGETTEDIFNLAEGIYSITISDSDNNTIISSEEIVEPNEFSLNLIGNDILCFGDSSGNISADLLGGNLPYSYQWSNDDTVANINSLISGSYNITIIDANNCEISDSIFISQPQNPFILNANINNVSCFGNSDGSIELNVSGGISPYQYLWSNGQNQSSLFLLEADAFSVSITDANSCSIIENLIVSEPAQINIEFTTNQVSCYGGNDGSINLNPMGGNSPYSFYWSNGNSTEDIMNLDSDTYNILIFDDNNCFLMENIFVPQPEEFNLNMQASPTSCFGFFDGAISISPTGGIEPYQDYTWSNGETSQNINSLSAGLYFAIVTDSIGCTAIDSAEIVSPTPLISTIESENISCYGSNDGSIDMTVFGGTSPYFYSWSFGATNEDIQNLSANIYAVIINDLNGCYTINISIIEEPEELEISSQISDLSNFGSNDGAIDITVLGGISPYEYIWSNSATQQNISNLVSGNYYVTISDINNCSLTEYFFVNTPFPQPPWGFSNTADNHTILIPDTIEISIENQQIQIGDYLGVFYDSLGFWACGGTILWQGYQTALSAWGEYNGNDGFTSNEEFIWKIWRASDQQEFFATPTYNTINFLDEGYFTTNGISGLSSLKAFSSSSQTIELQQGWSIFSINVDPFEASLDSIFSEIIGNVQLVKDGNGNTFFPQYNVNLIGNISLGEGYNINMFVSDTLLISGDFIYPENFAINLNTGWSILGYLRTSAAPIDLMLNSIISNIDIVKNDSGQIFWPSFSINQIGDMIPGKAYQINMSGSAILFYPAN